MGNVFVLVVCGCFVYGFCWLFCGLLVFNLVGVYIVFGCGLIVFGVYGVCLWLYLFSGYFIVSVV